MREQNNILKIKDWLAKHRLVQKLISKVREFKQIAKSDASEEIIKELEKTAYITSDDRIIQAIERFQKEINIKKTQNESDKLFSKLRRIRLNSITEEEKEYARKLQERFRREDEEKGK